MKKVITFIAIIFWAGSFLTYSESSIGELNGSYDTSKDLSLKNSSSGINDEYDSIIPSEFRVDTAYPDPFNSSLAIPVFIPERGEVNLTVYNLLGQKIHQSIRGYSAGEFTLVFNAKQTNHELESGVYFFRIDFGYQSFTQKVMLLK